ncbi:hypothetical protein [Coraliomargarita akajimensis]|uniref:SH3b domain-containing protein n=1 Tax=Coraliomargarita akajimensis (strain DSM 45221 / IAM 15411 / JCM 23193 / KCTC 12865 / 04OKA010-24) TaxID=583355 RepID=D5EIU2_CORAD|nr:hypothetical protein [Coraliomargarita akajimensis]ADE54341.1 hypothetical protein Caka_1321 [Coraliomargarita akajimensis DSM 45221]
MNLPYRIFALLSLAATLSAQDVMLRFHPDAAATIVGRVDANHPAFSRGQAVRDPELAAAGWFWTELKASFSGYVSTEGLAKDFSVATGTLIRSKASNQASVLTVVEKNDRIFANASDESAQWSQVEFTKAVPVYYLHSELPSTTALDTPRTALGGNHAEPAPQPIAAPYKRRINNDNSFTINRSGPVQVYETVTPPPPAPAAKPKPAEPLPESIMVERRESPTSNSQPLELGMQTLSGHLKRNRQSTENSYSLQLKTLGYQDAFVDISGIFISDLRPFLDKPVIINGKVESLSPGSDIRVIRAQSLKTNP